MEKSEHLITTDPEMEVLQLEKESAYEFRKRRHTEWRDNYTLSRNKLIPNRLTQRQTVNIPLMKYALASIMKEIDEPPEMYFKNLDNNEQKEVYFNEYWRKTVEDEKLKIKDIIDKKQALTYGRSFKKLNISDGRPKIEIIDPQEVLVHRFVDPANLDSAKVLIQTDIYRTLKDITENPNYKARGKNKLSTYYAEQQETLEQDDTLNKIIERNQKMADMGLDDAFDPKLGETYIELNEVYRKEYSSEEGEEIIFVYTVATPGGAVIELQKQKLHEVIGETSNNYWYDHFPFSSWATDPERTDFWSDAPADTIRGANQVLNSFYSQLVENRTLRNYNMHYYDSSNPEFIPQTFVPEPWGWYPLPGRPSDVMTTVEVPDLSESLDEIEYVINLTEKAVATTSAQTGSIENKSVTLGEVELALANAQDRVRSLALYYTESWRDFGTKFIKMLEGASDILEPVTISKEGRLGKKMYQKEISPKNWETKSGYMVEVLLIGEKEESDLNMIQKLKLARADMPMNVPLKNITNSRLLQFAGLSMEEIQQVQEFENQNAVAPEVGAMQDQATAPPEGDLPAVPAVEGAPFANQSVSG